MFTDELRSSRNAHPVALRPLTRAVALRSWGSWFRFEQTYTVAFVPIVRALLARFLETKRGIAPNHWTAKETLHGRPHAPCVGSAWNKTQHPALRRSFLRQHAPREVAGGTRQFVPVAPDSRAVPTCNRTYMRLETNTSVRVTHPSTHEQHSRVRVRVRACACACAPAVGMFPLGFAMC